MDGKSINEVEQEPTPVGTWCRCEQNDALGRSGWDNAISEEQAN